MNQSELRIMIRIFRRFWKNDESKRIILSWFESLPPPSRSGQALHKLKVFQKKKNSEKIRKIVTQINPQPPPHDPYLVITNYELQIESNPIFLQFQIESSHEPSGPNLTFQDVA